MTNQTPHSGPRPDGWEVIHTYTRADALRDGTLVDVTEAAREAGFRFPVAVTRAVWEGCVAWSDADNARKDAAQDETGRLWDVVTALHAAIRRARDDHARMDVPLYRVPRDGYAIRPQRTRLIAVCGPGDDAAPVITVMEPHED